jgi:hypothetical protein
VHPPRLSFSFETDDRPPSPQVIVRIESRPGVYCSWVIQVLGIAYFIYKISRIFSERSRYSAVRATLTIFA